MLVRRLLVVASLAALLAVVAAAPAAASHAWGNYHWARTSSPFTLKLGDNVSSAWDSYLSTASTDWSRSSVLDTTIVAGGARNKQCRPTNGRIEVCNGSYGFNGWLGVAQIWISGSHITQATTKVNDSYYGLAQYNTPEWRAHVMCQEIGHDFGLGHQDESGADLGTCMDYASNPDADNMHPNQHDYDQLVSIYGSHTDSSNSYSFAETGNVHGHVQWVSPSHKVERFGAGFEIHTFIVWVGGEHKH